MTKTKTNNPPPAYPPFPLLTDDDGYDNPPQAASDTAADADLRCQVHDYVQFLDSLSPADTRNTLRRATKALGRAISFQACCAVEDPGYVQIDTVRKLYGLSASLRYLNEIINGKKRRSPGPKPPSLRGTGVGRGGARPGAGRPPINRSENQEDEEQTDESA